MVASKLAYGMDGVSTVSGSDRINKQYWFSDSNENGYYSRTRSEKTMEVTKALAALQPLYGKGNVEIVTRDGARVRGTVRSMKTTQALTTPSVKVERADGQIVKVAFSAIVEIIDHNK